MFMQMRATCRTVKLASNLCDGFTTIWWNKILKHSFLWRHKMSVWRRKWENRCLFACTFHRVLSFTRINYVHEIEQNNDVITGWQTHNSFTAYIFKIIYLNYEYMYLQSLKTYCETNFCSARELKRKETKRNAWPVRTTLAHSAHSLNPVTS